MENTITITLNDNMLKDLRDILADKKLNCITELSIYNEKYQITIKSLNINNDYALLRVKYKHQNPLLILANIETNKFYGLNSEELINYILQEVQH